MKSCIAIAEPSGDGTAWWISVPDLPGVTSAADSARQILPQAQDALAAAIAAGASLPPALEGGAIPPYELAECHNPRVVLAPYDVHALAEP